MTAKARPPSISAESFLSTKKAGITSRQFRRIVSAALADLIPHVDDPLPADIRKAHGFPDIRTALEHVHFPSAADDLTKLNSRQSPYHRRLILKNFFCWN